MIPPAVPRVAPNLSAAVRRASRGVSILASDLPLFALLLLPFAGVAILAAKVTAAWHTYESATARQLARLLARVVSADLLLIAAAGVLVLLSRRLRWPLRGRRPLLAILYGLFTVAMVVHFVNAGFFMYFGAPLSAELVALAPAMLRYAPQVVNAESADLARLMAAAVCVPLVVVPLVWRRARARLVVDDRSWARGPWVALALVACAGLASGAPRLTGHRERALRRLSAAGLFLHVGTPPQGPARPLSPPQQRVLEELLGPLRHEGAAALAPLRGRRPNIVLWVWESVGERFLHSHHALGEAATPRLDRLASRGCVRFSRAYAECPLSVQSDWAMATGMSPPGNARIFITELPLPRHGPFLPALLERSGYRTAYISSSYLKSWGQTRFLTKASLDLLEDADTLANRDRYETDRWSIDGRAILDRFWEWLDGGASEQPFFAVLWNVESHHPYTWVGMPQEVRDADPYTRYRGVIGHTDQLLGEFHDELVARGLDRSTVIVVVGDHGQGMGRGDRGHDRFHSMMSTEDNLHVPLAFLHPELPRGCEVVDVPTTHADVYPTLADLAGAAVPAAIDGASLARPYAPRVLVGRAMTWWPLSARAGRYKLVQIRAEDPPELYDVAADPWEMRDVSLARPEVTDALLAHLRWDVARRHREDPSMQLTAKALHAMFTRPESPSPLAPAP